MGTIKLDKDEMLKIAGELSALKEEINYILNKTQETENVLRREKSVSTYSQERKLSDLQDLAYNLVREFDKISDNFYQAAKAYENSEDRINNLVNINKNNDIRNIIAINSMENTYFNSDNSKSKGKEETTFDKLKELTQEGWQLLKDYCGLYISAMDFMKDVCDNINTLIDGYIEDHEEFFAEFNAEHPTLSIIFTPLQELVALGDSTVNFLKEMTFGLGGNVLGILSNEYKELLENPGETLDQNMKSILMIKAILCPTSKEEFEIQNKALSGIWQDIKTDFNSEVMNGNPYTASRYVSNLVINIGSLFFGAGELKAAAGVKKADNVLDGLRAIDKIRDAGKLSNGELWLKYFSKTYGAENVEWTSKLFEGNGALRERVFANIEMSRLARESSGFSKDIDVFHLQYKYNMINNPGPLSNFRGNPASNFLGGRYNLKILEEDTILYRSGKSGGLTIPGKEQNALGQWFTREPADSAIKVRIDSAVKSQWIDPKTQVLTGTSPLESTYSIKIPKGTTIYEGPVGYQGDCYLGGENCNQIFISEPWKIRGVEPIKEIPLH